MRALSFSLPALLGLSLVLASEANAQNTTTSIVTFTVPSGRTALAQQACQNGDTIAARVDYNGTIAIGSISPELVVYRAKGSSCPAGTGTYTAPGDDVLVLETLSLTEANRAVPIAITREHLGASECPANTTTEVHFCAVVHQPPDGFNTLTDTVIGSQRLSVTYDSAPPAAPTAVSGNGGERTIYLTWTSENVSRFVVYYRPVSPPVDEANPCPALESEGADAGADPDAGPTEPQIVEEFRTHNVNDGSVRATSLSNLDNDRLYEIFVVSEDAAGNRSQESEHIFAEPRVVADFYRRYRCAGGIEEGGFGCGTSGAAMAPLAGLMVLALLRRARKNS